MAMQRQKVSSVPKRKLPSELTSGGLALQLLCQLLIISILASLWGLSQANNGLPLSAEVVTSSESASTSPLLQHALVWGYPLLWTSVPAFILTIYAKFYGTMTTRLKSCQPLLELMAPSQALPATKRGSEETEKSKPQPSSVKLTLLLDYNRYKPLEDSWRALQNRHYLVSACMLVSLLLVLASGLGAGVFTVATINVSQTSPVLLTSSFNEFAPANFSTLPALDAVSATLVSDASFGPWLTQKYSFNPFAAVDPPSRPGNLTGETLAYYSTLDCAIIAGDGLIISAASTSDQNATAFTDFTVNYNFTDRDCPVSETASVTPQKLFTQAWVKTDCGPTDESGRDIRLILIAGQYDENSPTGLANNTVLSCIPTFWNATARVTTAAINATSHPGQLLDFSVSSETAVPLRPYFWPDWLEELPLYETLDIRSTFNMNRLGNIVYNLALARNSDNPLDKNLLLEALPDAFNAIVASHVAKWAYQASNAPKGQLQGTFSAPETRLFVVPGVAAAVIALLVPAVLSILWAWFVYVPRNRVALENEVKLLLGNGMLFRDSLAGTATGTFGAYIEAVEQSVSAKESDLTNVDLVEYAKREPGLNDWDCWMDDTDGIRRIRLKPKGVESDMK